MFNEPLSFAEVDDLADLYVTPDHDRNFYIADSALTVACDSLGLVAVFDAESELVCLVPKDKADLMTRLINTYPARCGAGADCSGLRDSDHWTDKYEAWVKLHVSGLDACGSNNSPQINWLNNALDEFRRLSGKASR